MASLVYLEGIVSLEFGELEKSEQVDDDLDNEMPFSISGRELNAALQVVESTIISGDCGRSEGILISNVRLASVI